MPGFDNDVVYAKNVDFSGGTPVAGKMLLDGQLLIGRTALNAGGTHIDVGTLTAGTGVTITNGAGTITIASADLHVAKWIVNATPNAGGNQTTIQAAINAAVAGEDIFIMPGTYTENLSLKAGVNLTSFPCDGYRDLTAATNNVTIVGKMTYSSAGTVVIANVKLQTNADNILSVTGSAASIVYLTNCFLSCTNATGIVSTATGSEIRLINCGASLTTTGITFFDVSGGGGLEIDGGFYNNPGNSAVASTWSAGTLTINNCRFGHHITSTGTSASLGANISNSFFIASTTTFTHGNSGGVQISIWNCSFFSGSLSAINISNASASMWLANCIIDSSNTNAITGVGSIEIGGPIIFSNSSSGINTTTQTFDTVELARYRAHGQPAFLTSLAANTAAVTGDATVYTIVWDTEIFDQGSNISGSTFTAPVTGRYRFELSVLWSGIAAAHTTGNMSITTSNRGYLTNQCNPFATAGGSQGSNVISVLADMDAADTCTTTTAVSGGTKVITVSTGGATDPRSYFSGNLVC